MKFSKAAVIVAIAISGLVLTGCGKPGPLDTYTGPAVMKEHHRSGKSCYGTFEAPNGLTESIRIGRKSVCYQIDSNSGPFKDGDKVKIRKGDVIR